MESRVDLSALERSRMLGSLSALRGATAFSEAEQRGSTSGEKERPRVTSPSPLEQYPGHYLAPSSLHPSSSTYAMMAAGYLAGGHVPDSLKHLLPEMTYWSSAAQSESYTRYLLGNMYYPYLPYMPATESLALFAHNSHGAAQMEALQAQAVQHRIYDLQKEALQQAGQGMLPHGLHPYSHLYPPSSSPLEATNLSLPSSSKARAGDRKEDERRGAEDKREPEVRGRGESDAGRRDTRSSEHGVDFSSRRSDSSERKRSKLTKTDDIDKIKSSSKSMKSPVPSEQSSSAHSKSDSRTISDLDNEFRRRTVSPGSVRRRHISGGSLGRERHPGAVRYDNPLYVKTGTMHSPPLRQKALSSPIRALHGHQQYTHDRKDYTLSPSISSKDTVCIIEQDMPENLCIKDKKRETQNEKSVKEKKEIKVALKHSPGVGKGADTSSTVTVTSTLTVITSDISAKDKIAKRKASSVSPCSQISPSLSQTHTSTTYSLPYYHNLFSRAPPNEGKKVHATTYVPEIGTISSPVAGAPAVIQVKEVKRETDVEESKDDKKNEREPKVSKESDSDAFKVSRDDSSSGEEICDVVGIDSDDSDKGDKVSDDKKIREDSKTLRSESVDTTSCNNLECVQQDKETKTVSEAKAVKTLEDNTEKDAVNAFNGGEKRKRKSPTRRRGTNEKSVIDSSDSTHSNVDLFYKSDKTHASDSKCVNKKEIAVTRNSVKTCSTNSKDINPLSCDLNHNSTNENSTDGIGKPQKRDRCTPRDVTDVITVSDTEEKDNDKTKDMPKKGSDAVDNGKQKAPVSSKQTTAVKPISVSKNKPEGDNSAFDAKIPVSTNQDTARSKLSDSKHSEGIPIGIAVARQRTIAPKLSNDKETTGKSNDEPRVKNPVADVKPIRPLKVIRPSTKGATSSPKCEKRNELPANLIVTGGTSPAGVFWPEDPTSRQLAAQFLQGPAPLAPTTWYGQTGSFPLPPPSAISTVGNTSVGTGTGNQLPLTVPAGYKLAQDSITGQILLLPSSTDVFDSSRMFGGLPLGASMNAGSAFAPATIVTPGGQGVNSAPTVVSQSSLFAGQTVLTDRTTNLDMTMQQYLPMFGHNVLAAPEVKVTDDKLASSGASGLLPAPLPARTLHEGSTCASAGAEQHENKETVVGTIPAVIRTDNTLSVADDSHPIKQEPATVQSRGTSPMLPASDSCTEEHEHDHEHEAKSDTNSDDVIDICDVNSKTQIHDSEFSSNVDDAESKPIVVCDSVVNVVKGKTIDSKRDEDENKKENSTESIIEKNETTRSSNAETNSIHDFDNKDSKTTSNSDLPAKSNRNIFNELSVKYDPFMDPQVLQAADGLELLSALAEKSAHVSNSGPPESDTKYFKEPEKSKPDKHMGDIKEKKTKHDNKKESIPIKSERNKDPFAFEADDSLTKSRNVETKAKGIAQESVTPKKRSRVKSGFPIQPKQEPKAPAVEGKKMTTFCGISVPEDDDVIDSIEMEMKMRLSELQRRYKEKQKQLAKLTPKKPKEVVDKDKPLEKQKSAGDVPRGPGRPKKRSRDSTSLDSSIKSTKVKKSEVSSRKSSPTGSPSSSGSSGHHGHTSKRKKMAEMLVDRVFRKAGSSFKIPLSKKVNLIAPARIEFPGVSTSVEKSDHARHKKSLDFKRLIKRSRLSQLGGKDASFAGGFWSKKYHERKHHFPQDIKAKRKKKETETTHSTENGLGLLAEYAAKSREDISKKKRKSEEATPSTSPDSPNKKRKPGRPRKCDTLKPGVTETIVDKQSKHMDFFRWQTEEPKDRKITLEGKTPLKPLYLDEWNVRRSERIFLSDPSPQTSPNPISPGTSKPKTESPGLKVKTALPTSSPKSDQPGPSKNEKDKTKFEKAKKSLSMNMSMKVKKKYSAGSSTQQQKAREKTTELLKATRDRLNQSRRERKEKQRLVPKITVDDVSDPDDAPLSVFAKKHTYYEPPSCRLNEAELEEGMRILVFQEGLFHEGELKAIRPPDIYGAVLDNERKTRPHIYSLEDILKEAIKEVKTGPGVHLKEGTRICAYWSQQYSCLYPGTIAKGTPNPNASSDLYNVEFDDGDTGKIPLDHIRIIPQDFPLVDYDPDPLLLLTARRRTLSMSESSEPRKSQSDTPKKPQTEQAPRESCSRDQSRDSNKEVKIKRGPGRPPKTDRLISVESVGDEDVFVSDGLRFDSPGKKTKAEYKQCGGMERRDSSGMVFIQPRDLWQWSGSSTKRPGMKGKARKEFYKSIYRHREQISVGDSAVFISTGRPNLPYVGRIESFWGTWSGQMVVKVKWFYHPEETKGGKRLLHMKGALFRSDHEDENDVQTISHKCDVIPYAEYRRRVDVISHENNDDVYYLAGSYEPTVGNIKFESGVLPEK